LAAALNPNCQRTYNDFFRRRSDSQVAKLSQVYENTAFTTFYRVAGAIAARATIFVIDDAIVKL
jgi:hypothetical protein